MMLRELPTPPYLVRLIRPIERASRTLVRMQYTRSGEQKWDELKPALGRQ